eukprot:6540751-Pyramimonas_sp.AAC.1
MRRREPRLQPLHQRLRAVEHGPLRVRKMRAPRAAAGRRRAGAGGPVRDVGSRHFAGKGVWGHIQRPVE